MKITSVDYSNRKKEFEIQAEGRALRFPYAKAGIPSGSGRLVDRAWVDDELGREGFSFMLADGSEGAAHIDHVLEYNQDPQILWELFMHKLTVEIHKRLKERHMPKRQLVRLLHTSPAQIYRLLDEGNPAKSLPQLFTILDALDYDVGLSFSRGRDHGRIQWRTRPATRQNGQRRQAGRQVKLLKTRKAMASTA